MAQKDALPLSALQFLVDQEKATKAAAPPAVAPDPATVASPAAPASWRNMHGQIVTAEGVDRASPRSNLPTGVPAGTVDTPQPSPDPASAAPTSWRNMHGQLVTAEGVDRASPRAVQGDSPSKQDKRDSVYVNHDRPEESSEVAIDVGQGYKDLFGTTTINVPSSKEERDGQWVDTIEVVSLVQIVDKSLRSKKHKEIMAKGGYGNMSTEEFRAIEADIQKEAASIAMGIHAQSTAGMPITNPKKILTDKQDTKTIAEGGIPERDSLLGGLAYDAFTTAQDVYSGVTETLGIKDSIKEGTGISGTAREAFSAATGVDDFLDEEGNLVIPGSGVRGTLVSPRQMVAYAYPSAGYGYGGGNRFSKLAQDALSFPLAAADAQQRIYEKKDSELRAEGKEAGLIEWFESMDEAKTDTEMIAELRANKSGWDYIGEADTTPMTVLPYALIRSFTGVNMYTALERETGGLVQLRDVDPTGAVIQRVRPRGTAKALVGAYGFAEELIEGGDLDDAMEAREKTGMSVPAVFGMYTGQKYMTGDQMNQDFLGPMTAAVLSPDGFMAAIKGVSVGVKVARAGKGLMYAKHATRQADGLGLLREDVVRAMDAGEDIVLAESAGWNMLTPAVKIQVREGLRGIVGVNDRVAIDGVLKEVVRREAEAEKSLNTIAKMVADSGAKKAPPPPAPAAAAVDDIVIDAPQGSRILPSAVTRIAGTMAKLGEPALPKAAPAVEKAAVPAAKKATVEAIDWSKRTNREIREELEAIRKRWLAGRAEETGPSLKETIDSKIFLNTVRENKTTLLRYLKESQAEEALRVAKAEAKAASAAKAKAPSVTSGKDVTLDIASTVGRSRTPPKISKISIDAPQGSRILPSLATDLARGAYRPLYRQIPAANKAARVAAAEAEAVALQHRAVTTGLVEGMLEAQIRELKRFGVMARGAKKAAPGEFKAARKAFKKAFARLEKVAGGKSPSPAKLNKALTDVNNAFVRMASHGSKKANASARALLVQAKASSAKVRSDLSALIRTAHAEKSISSTADAAAMIKNSDDAVARILGEVAAKSPKGEGLVVGSSGMRANISAFLEGGQESMYRAAQNLRSGRASTPAGLPTSPDYRAFEALSSAEKTTYLKSMGGEDVWRAIQEVPLGQTKKGEVLTAGAVLRRGDDLTPVQATRVLNTAAQHAKNVPFSAWGMQTYLSATQGVDLIGKATLLDRGVRRAAMVEGYIAGLRTSGMRIVFKMVAGEDVYNAGRLGEEMSNIGRKEVFEIVSSMQKADKPQEEIFRTIGQWMDLPPSNALGLFGQAGTEAPLMEGFRFLRNLGKTQRQNTTAFQAIQHAFLGTGRKSGDTARALETALHKIIDSGENIRYEEFVRRMRAVAYQGGVGEGGLLKMHEYLSAGVINAASGFRMIDDLARIQSGFDIKTLQQAVNLSKNKGTDTLNRAAEVRALFQQMGISPENFRSSVKRGGKGSGASWDLVLSADNSTGLKAVVPRPLLDFLGTDIAWMVKAEDAGKTWRLTSDLSNVAPTLASIVMLIRKGMTSGILFPRTSYFVNNLHGGISQAITTGGYEGGLASTKAMGRAGRRLGTKMREKVGFLDSGVPAMDARLAEATRTAGMNGQRHASSIPAPQMGSINPMIRGILDDAIVPPDHIFRTAAGEAVEKRQIIREMLKEGVFETRAATFLTAPTAGLDGVRPRSSKIGAEISRFLDGDWANTWSKVMDEIETEQRIGMFMHQRVTKGASGVDAGRVVREAFFDWKYPPRLFAAEFLSRVPVMMFGSMWRNAVTHTAGTMASGAKSRRLIQMYKAQEVGSEAASTGSRDNADPWYGPKGSQSFITMDATGDEPGIGKAMLGAETGSTAIVLPEFISLGLVAIAINTAIMTAGVVETGFDEPITRDNLGRYTDYLRATSSQFVDPFLTLMAQGIMGSGGDPRFGGDYDGPVRMNENETTALTPSALDGVSDYLGAEEKAVKATGGSKTVADQRRLRLMRLLPLWRRTVNIMGPLVRQQWGDPAEVSFLKSFEVGGPVWEIMANEMGRAKVHIPTKKDEQLLRIAREEGAAKRATE